jgi:phosphoribosylaminoimidazole-succinocarboxamide synthase
VRQWLIANGFQGKDGQTVPEMSEEFVSSVSDRYIELYENITGDKFEKSDTSKIKQRIEIAVTEFLVGHI